MADRPTRFMLDSNVADQVLDDGALRLLIAKSWDILVTHVQVEEVLDTPDAERGRRLLLALLGLGARMVPTAAHVLGISRLGHSRLGTSDLGGRVTAFQEGNSRYIQDGLIAVTALREGAVLVTAEKARGRLRTHFPELTVWSPGQFRRYAEEHNAQRIREALIEG